MSLANIHSLGNMQAMHLAQVVDNVDPDSRGRIKVRLHANALELWANVVVASAGPGYGVTCIPKRDEQVVIAFVTPDQALVIGAIWAGTNSLPNAADPVEDHYLISTPELSELEFDDVAGPKIEVRTRSGYSIKIDETGAGSITIVRGGQKIHLSSSEVKISGTKIVLDAANIEMNAAQIKGNAAISNFSGIVNCDTCIATAVVGTSYTPGAGNIW